MKKANGIKLLTLAGLMATAACTGDFLNKNTNPDQATDEMLSWDNLSTGSAFAQMTKNVIPSFQLVGDKEYGSANYQVIEDLATTPTPASSAHGTSSIPSAANSPKWSPSPTS